VSRPFEMGVDPARLASFRDPTPQLDDMDPPEAEEDEALVALRAQVLGMQREELRRLLGLIPAIEADVIELRLRGVAQREIGAVLGITQAAVSHRIAQAMRRLKWLHESEYLTFSAKEIREALTPLTEVHTTVRWAKEATILSPIDVEILVAYHETANQLHVCARLGIKQPRMRERLIRAVDQLRLQGTKYERYYRLFASMLAHPNILGHYDSAWAKKREAKSPNVLVPRARHGRNQVHAADSHPGE